MLASALQSCSGNQGLPVLLCPAVRSSCPNPLFDPCLQPGLKQHSQLSSCIWLARSDFFLRVLVLRLAFNPRVSSQDIVLHIAQSWSPYLLPGPKQSC